MRIISRASGFANAAFAIAVVLAGAAAAQAGVTGQAAGASRAGAGRLAAAPFGGTSRLSSISCRSQSWCLAAGGYTTADHARHSLAAIWTGTRWRTLKNPPGTGLSKVACSSKTFCMAAGGPTGLLTWNGTSWRKIESPSGGLASLTCASRTLCMRVAGHVPVVSAWNGASWHQVRQMAKFCAGTAPGPCGLYGVSCGSARTCMAVGTWTVSQEPVQDPLGWFWNGKKWLLNDPPGDGNPAESNAVGCAGGFCLATGSAYSEQANGGIAAAATFSAAAGAWTDIAPDLGVLCTGALATCNWASQVACGLPSNCMTLGAAGIQWWNGTQWRAEKAVSAGRGSDLLTLGCGGGDCLAVGYRTSSGRQRTLAERWNGSSWSIIGSPK